MLNFLSQHPKQAKVSRRFLIVEGIYMNNGSLCNIRPMIKLKHEHKLRFFIDETVSFGTLGKTGKGITEYMNMEVRLFFCFAQTQLFHFIIPFKLNDIDLIMATLETSVGSIGGFCAGTTYVIVHQTLAGLGKNNCCFESNKSKTISSLQATSSAPPCRPCWPRAPSPPWR